MSPYAIAGAVLLGAAAMTAGVAWHKHELSAAHQAGYDEAVEEGRKQQQKDAAHALEVERNNRELFQIRDDRYNRLEFKYAQAVDDAQRRMRTGTDRLRCPAADPLPAVAAPADRSAAAVAATDQSGAPVVSEVAADILGLAADSARLVRKYDELTVRYEACRAMNNGTAEGDPAP